MHFVFSQLIQLSFALGASFVLMLFGTKAFAEPVTIRYIDESVGFVVLDQAPGDWKDGDQICVFESKVLPSPAGTSPANCENIFRWHTRQPLLFPRKDAFERLEVGMILEAKKIYLSDKDRAAPVDLSQFQNEIQKAADHSQKVGQMTDEISRNKFRRGAPPAATAEAPAIEGDDFPEIFIPKLRKTRQKRSRDTSEIAMIRKGIQRTLKNRDQLSYQFATEEVKEPIVPLPVKEDYPNPLNSALKITAIYALPVAPMASYQSLKFQTITNATVVRDTLWLKSKTKLIPDIGAGFDLQLTSRMKDFFTFGWRYHTYNSLDSLSTFDEFDVSLIASSKSRVSEQLIHLDWGRMQYWTDWFYTNYAVGSDLAYTDLNFDSRVARGDSSESFILAHARHNFMTLAPRIRVSTGIERWGFGFNLGMTVQVPIFEFKKTFKGDVTVPERIRFTGSANDDLKRSLTQTRNAVGVEFLFGISYQPQRNSR